ncbi:MAG: GIY-YIG nuclease family protein [Flavobacteriaceae bacterium]|jgi:putative endonuclease
MIACYILYSPTLQKFYTGVTQDDVTSRLEKHNTSQYGKHYTSQTQDWEVFFTIECESLAQALKIEKHIKSMKSVTYIQNLKQYPQISQKLKEKYKE